MPILLLLSTNLHQEKPLSLHEAVGKGTFGVYGLPDKEKLSQEDRTFIEEILREVAFPGKEKMRLLSFEWTPSSFYITFTTDISVDSIYRYFSPATQKTIMNKDRVTFPNFYSYMGFLPTGEKYVTLFYENRKGCYHLFCIESRDKKIITGQLTIPR